MPFFVGPGEGAGDMITTLHFLLTYECNYECDHCFLCSSPRAGGTFTLEQIEAALREAAWLDTVTTVYFEGGEPFLYYSLLLAAVRKAREMGFHVGVVTNGYFAVSEAEALLWLEPLAEAGLDEFSASDSRFHNPAQRDPSPARIAFRAAQKLSLTASLLLCTASPNGAEGERGEPLLYRGRAAEKLAGQAVSLPAGLFNSCPCADFARPQRLYLDAFGNVHICQGLIIGNMWERSLAQLVWDYRAEEHPICGPLAEGGPLQLAETYELTHASAYADACHFCYSMRLELRKLYPRLLAPRHLYGRE